MIINQIDPLRLITHRLYRQHCTPDGDYHVKDIEKIGRGLDKILIIDNLAESFSKQQENGILVKDWFDDMDDTELSMLIPFLKTLVVNKVPDVRAEIRKVLEYSEE
jgi:carboxy-terminal domain RNA polymerase II polypeptide A small phosphatase